MNKCFDTCSSMQIQESLETILCTFLALLNCCCWAQQLYKVRQHIFISFKIGKKDWAKWAKWARILKNIHTDEQLYSWICFLVFAYSNMYQNIHLSIPFKIRKKDWAKWAKWARIHKNTLRDEQLCSLTCFFVFDCLNKYQNIRSFIAFEIRKKISN